MESEQKKKKILKKLKNKYRLVILNDATFEEKFSYRLSPLNLVTLIISFVFVITALVATLIIFTPLRENIPGYTDVSLRQDLTALVLKSDSLERELATNNSYLNKISSILKGEALDTHDTLISAESTNNVPNKNLVPSTEDSALRAYVEREESFSLNQTDGAEQRLNAEINFFPPLKGSITEKFDPNKEHFGIDIVAPKNEAIKAALNGTVIFSEWTVETGYVIHLQHEKNITTIYKHNSVLLKKTGDMVKAGEAIAIIGNTGKLTSGPHLHFELWRDGVAVNPTKYINFN
ncbi:MAG: peptidase M23 [Verrucomicrobia bacterium]|nr:peptidase M23 [Verrucomicrobiota bacterium]|tara:strand:- start:96 stop:968 length:873 start_codon:yes stop_codon:yes gene_type:complete